MLQVWMQRSVPPTHPLHLADLPPAADRRLVLKVIKEWGYRIGEVDLESRDNSPEWHSFRGTTSIR